MAQSASDIDESWDPDFLALREKPCSSCYSTSHGIDSSSTGNAIDKEHFPETVKIATYHADGV